MGISTVVPSKASVGLISLLTIMSSPSLEKWGCLLIRILRYRSPVDPPFEPGWPFPTSLNLDPSLDPSGTLKFVVIFFPFSSTITVRVVPSAASSNDIKNSSNT